jgi:tellurite resistance protein TehA-like permease
MRMPFALTWWSFTFPVGTVVTGTTRLAVQTGLPLLRVAAVVGYGLLVGAWSLVAIQTARQAIRGTLLRVPPEGSPSPLARKTPRTAPANR